MIIQLNITVDSGGSSDITSLTSQQDPAPRL